LFTPANLYIIFTTSGTPFVNRGEIGLERGAALEEALGSGTEIEDRP
jgi:hypothetical protein